MKEFWTEKANRLMRDFIKLQIENNDYYENIKKSYEKYNCVSIIFDLWEDYDYYSIYKVMDAIENYMKNHNIDSVEQAVNDEGFDLEGEIY